MNRAAAFVFGAILGILACVQGLGSQTARQRPKPIHLIAANWKNQAADSAPLDRGQSQPSAPKKEHSVLFRYRTGRNLPELAAQAKSDESILVEVHQSSGWGLPPGTFASYPHPYLVVIASGADAIVVATAKNSASGLTPEKEFIYTDWQFEVGEILKDNHSSPMSVFADITVTRPGGTLTLHGRKVDARHSNFLQFVPGGKYLLFLRFLPATETYEAFGDTSFELQQSRVRKLSKTNPLRWTEEPDAREFVAEVRAAISYKP